MIEIKDIYVQSFDLNYLDVFWQISADEDVLDYDLYILRSQSPAGPYSTIAGPIQDVQWFRDGGVDLRLGRQSYYYKIKVENRATGDSREWPENTGVTMAAELSLDGMEIARLESILFREHAGRRVVILPVRTSGRRCPRCWDSSQHRRTVDNCIVCFDTSWVGGFLHPVEAFIQIDPLTEKISMTSHMGEVQMAITSARMSNFPPVKVRDVIVEAENKRWRVSAISKTERLRAVIRQELSLIEIPRGAVEYEFPVDLESNASPIREFSNRQSPGKGEINDSITTYFGFRS